MGQAMKLTDDQAQAVTEQVRQAAFYLMRVEGVPGDDVLPIMAMEIIGRIAIGYGREAAVDVAARVIEQIEAIELETEKEVLQ